MSENTNFTGQMIDFLLSLPAEGSDYLVELARHTSKLECAKRFAASEGSPLALAQRKVLEVLSCLLMVRIDPEKPEQSEKFLEECTRAVLALVEIDMDEFPQRVAADDKQLPIPFVLVGAD